MPPRLCPEHLPSVEAYHEKLRLDPAPTLAAARAAREKWQAGGTDLLPWSGWPLRPFFLPKQQMDQLAAQLLGRLRLFLQTLTASSASEICSRFGLSADFFERIALGEAFADPRFLDLLRPDGFLHPDRYVLGEINFGNGLIVSNAYTEILAEYHQTEPILNELGTPVLRPFQAYLDLLASLLPETGEKPPTIGLLSFSWEYDIICSWEKRVRDQLDVARRRMAERGWDTEIVHESDVYLDDEERPVHRPTGKVLDLVAHITINTSFMDEPHRMSEDFQIWAGTHVGKAPLYKPLAALVFDKGTLTWLQEFPEPPCDDYSVPIATTEFPLSSKAVEYRLQREEWVLKRSFDGKDTHVGRSAAGRVWNRAIAGALDSKEYILQRYETMPRTLMPITTDGEQIEWVEVCFEFSPFLIAGRFAGACVRYAPAAEGLIMSPPPEGMGFGVVAVV